MKQLGDIMKGACADQGYVPESCMLPGPIILAITMDGKDPCDGCNHDRSVCGGRPDKTTRFRHDVKMTRRDVERRGPWEEPEDFEGL